MWTCIGVEACVADMADWMERNQVKLNREKSEAIIFVTARQRVGLLAEVSLSLARHLGRLCAIWVCCSIED